jgi:prepilin-type processing-associated H-X9-DG protein
MANSTIDPMSGGLPEERRYAANFAFADGRVLLDSGKGAAPSPLDEAGRPNSLRHGRKILAIQLDHNGIGEAP